ncbi:MAG: folylpolyglutamate synthase/dihydrofolate synthase family protein [Cyanobacteria bacterium P01_D01_bin.105]
MTAPFQTPSIQTAVEEDLQSFARFGVDLGLDRIEALLAAMGNPHRAVPIIHVAGTNGKGSVCAYLSSVLTAAGYRTGRYTSPHLINWTERICLDGVPISWPALQASLAEVKAAMDTQNPTPTQFEVFTAAAWHYFAAQQVDVAVVEVGLGGRLDATNVCRQPLATVIVSIGRDHWQRLGDTLAKIAGEKAGILKTGVDAIVGPLPPEARAVVAAKAEAVNAPITWVEPATATAGNPAALTYCGIEYPQVLLGEHQKVNSACAIAALQSLCRQGWRISAEAIARGMGAVQWPGRLQKAHWQGHELLIDGAHNRESARSLRTYIDHTYPNQSMTWLMGMLNTKDHEGVFTELLRRGDRLHLVPVPGHLTADLSSLKALAQTVCPTLVAVETYDDLSAALPAATQATLGVSGQIASGQITSGQITSGQSASGQSVPTVLCGSLYLIGCFFERYS